MKKLINGKANAATTLAGYGITDGMTATEIASAISTAIAGTDHLMVTGIVTIVKETPQKIWNSIVGAVTKVATWGSNMLTKAKEVMNTMVRAGRTQQASWGRLRRWKMQRALARRAIPYMMITARRYIPQRGSRQAQAFRLAYR